MSHYNCTTCNDQGFYLKRTQNNIAVYSSCSNCDAFAKNFLSDINSIELQDSLILDEFTELETEDFLLLESFLEFIDQQNLSEEEIAFLNPGISELKNLLKETKKENNHMAIMKPFIAEIVKEEVKVQNTAPAPSTPSPAPNIIENLKKAVTNATQTQTTEQTMATTTTKKERAVNAAKSIGRKMQEGAVQGMVGQANREVISLVEKRLGEQYPEFLKTTAGRKALEIIVPSLVMLICEMDENKKIPGHNYVRSAAELAVTNASADAAGDIVSVVIQEIMPLLGKYVEAGKMLEGTEQEEKTEEEVPDFTTMLEKSRAVA